MFGHISSSGLQRRFYEEQSLKEKMSAQLGHLKTGKGVKSPVLLKKQNETKIWDRVE